MLRYASARDPEGVNVALLACRAFAASAPIDRQTWRLNLGVHGARAVCDFPEAAAGIRSTGVRGRSAHRRAAVGALSLHQASVVSGCIRLGRMQHRPVFDLDRLFRGQPPERRFPEKASARHHLTTRFGKRRDAELYRSRAGPPVPRRVRAAVVFFPDADPRKIGAAPHVPKTNCAAGENAANHA